MKRMVVLFVTALMALSADVSAGSSRPAGLITFESSRLGSTAIFTMKPDGTRLRGPFAAQGPGLPASPQLSPDGARIAYSMWTYSCLPQQIDCSFDSSIWVMDADGSGPQQLTDETGGSSWSPSWAPDGKTIVFERDTDATYGDLYTLTETSPGVWAETQITDRPGAESAAAFSPNGKFIAYAYYDDDDPVYVPGEDDEVWYKSEVYVMRADGSGDHVKVTDWPATENTVPTWSPSSRKIAFVRYGEKGLGIWVVNLDGSGKKRLISGTALSPSWSPDGRYIVFQQCNRKHESNSCRIARFDRRTGRTKVIADAPAKYEGNPHWGGASR